MMESGEFKRIPVTIEVNDASTSTFNKLTKLEGESPNTTVDLVGSYIYVASVNKEIIFRLINYPEVDKIRVIKSQEKLDNRLYEFVQSNAKLNDTVEVNLECFPYVLKSVCESSISSFFVSMSSQDIGFKGVVTKANITGLAKEIVVRRVTKFEASLPAQDNVEYVPNDKT